MTNVWEEIDWDEYFLGMAEYASRKSKDPSTKVGAVIVRPDKTVCSVGFNGFHRKMRDDPALYADRETKLKRTIHGEVNAMLFSREPLDGYTLYTWPFEPCSNCTLQVIQSGIVRVVTKEPTSEQYTRWKASFIEARAMFAEAGVELVYL